MEAGDCRAAAPAAHHEALEWSRRFPAPGAEAADGEIEVRQMAEFDDGSP